MEGRQIAGARLGDAGLGAQDRTAERLAIEGLFLGQFEDQVVGNVSGLGDLLGDDPLFLGQVAGVQARPEDQVRHHRHGQRQAALERADLEAGAIVAGGGVELAALGLDGLDDLTRCPLAGGPKHHVLEQMRPAGLVRALIACAAPDRHRERQGLQPRHRVADDSDAVGKGVDGGRFDRLRPPRSRGHRP